MKHKGWLTSKAMCLVCRKVEAYGVRTNLTAPPSSRKKPRDRKQVFRLATDRCLSQRLRCFPPNNVTSRGHLIYDPFLPQRKTFGFSSHAVKLKFELLSEVHLISLCRHYYDEPRGGFLGLFMGCSPPQLPLA